MSVASKPTKELARALGFLRVIKENKILGERKVQCFTHLIVLDFEATCWKGMEKNDNQPEIIEFSAVILNTHTGQLEENFQQFVFPLENPKLSDFCISFTGIRQQDVDDGVPIWTCLLLFNNWLKKHSDKHYIDISNIEEFNKNYAFVTWTNWDLGVCLEKECGRKRINKSDIFNLWIDLKLSFKKFYERKPLGLKASLHDVGLEFKGREHCGLDDAKNTAYLAWKMICDGCELQITSGVKRKT